MNFVKMLSVSVFFRYAEASEDGMGALPPNFGAEGQPCSDEGWWGECNWNLHCEKRYDDGAVYGVCVKGPKQSGNDGLRCKTRQGRKCDPGYQPYYMQDGKNWQRSQCFCKPLDYVGLEGKPKPEVVDQNQVVDSDDGPWTATDSDDLTSSNMDDGPKLGMRQPEFGMGPYDPADPMEYILAMDVMLLGLIAAVYNFARLCRTKRSESERNKENAIFVSFLRGVVNFSSFCLQLVLMVTIVFQFKDPSKASVYALLVTVNITTVIYLVELLTRPISLASVLHHLVAVLAWFLIYGAPSVGGLYSFGPLTQSKSPDKQDLPTSIYLGCSIGLFASSAFFTDFAMVYYHSCKNTNPMGVYRALRAAFYFAIASKIIIHTTYFVLFGLMIERGLLDFSFAFFVMAVVVFWMATEYYLIHVLRVIGTAQFSNRVNPEHKPAPIEELRSTTIEELRISVNDAGQRGERISVYELDRMVSEIAT